MARREGGRIVVDNLITHGVDTVFQVPGESFLPILDALHHSGIRTITCRHEAGASNMAEAYGKLTGQPGVCIVTRGPGACHASVGVHTAKQDSTPMILLVGQVDRPLRGREAFQEVDLAAMFGWSAKWVTEVENAAQIPAVIEKAWHTALSGRPGPVVIGLPEDMLKERAVSSDGTPTGRVVEQPIPGDIDAFLKALQAARRPLIVVGGSVWSDAASTHLEAFAKTWELPVCVTFRRQDRIDNRSPQYVGDLSVSPAPYLVDALKQSDLIVALGTRLGDLTTGGFEWIKPPKPQQTLVHVFPDRDEIGRVFDPHLPIVASPEHFLKSVTHLKAPEEYPWRSWTKDIRASYLAHKESPHISGSLDMRSLVTALGKRLGKRGIVACDAGNFAQWIQRYYEFRTFRTQIAPTSGAMGYAVPAGVAAGLVFPDRKIVSIAGDGGFMMSMNELATAVMFKIKTVFIVVNNGMYGTIRVHQERQYPRRPNGTNLSNPDFVSLATSIGLTAFRIKQTRDIDDVLDKAFAQDGPALVEVTLDPEIASVDASLTEIRETALSRENCPSSYKMEQMAA